MIKHSLFHIVSILLLLNSVSFLSNCNEEEMEPFETEVPASTHTCRMTFDVDFTGFDAQDGSTRASVHGWDDGDVVYLSFTTSGNGTVGGTAIYDAANNDWTVTYTGTLSSTEQGSVKVYYYDGEVTKSSNTLTIDPTVGVYADLKGSYKYSRENGVNVSASLSPQTSRIRFKGEPEKTITVSGIKSFTEYDQQSGALTATPISSSVTVSSDGYTPYIYGFFADSSKPTISINSDGCRFTKDCSSSIFKIGVSGWMNVPTRNAHEKWEMEDLSEAHVVLTDTDHDGVGETLIFYYDDVDHSEEGLVFGLVNTYHAYPFWYEFSSNITNVIFDSGFTDARPTCTDLWFSECSKLTSISGIKYLDTSAVTSMYGMFEGCSSLTSLDVSNFNTEAVIDMGQMFAGCSSLTSLNVSSFNTAAVASMVGMFQNCSGLTSLNVFGFNTTAVTNMEFMFAGCSSLTSLNVSSFNTATVTNMSGMFGGCSSLTRIDVSSFNTAAVTNMSMMFSSCSSLSSLVLSGFNTASVTSMLNMFFDCSSLTLLDVSGFNTVSVKDMTQMFSGCSGLVSLDLSNFSTNSVTKMDGIFTNCSNLASLDLSSFNTSAVISMAWMFEGCSSLTSLDVSSFNTAAVTSMWGMFQNCSSLTSLNVSGFNTATVKNMIQMFCDCSNLTSLDISNFVISSETTISSLFVRCNKLLSINVGNNDFSANGADNNVFWGVGSSASPCNLVINSGFDKSVLGSYNGRYYRWRGGYFAEPTIQN